jgi:hypothetical protein
VQLRELNFMHMQFGTKGQKQRGRKMYKDIHEDAALPQILERERERERQRERDANLFIVRAIPKPPSYCCPHFYQLLQSQRTLNSLLISSVK